MPRRVSSLIRTFSGMIRPFDYAVLAIAVVIVAGLSTVVFARQATGSVVRVQSDDQVWLYPLNEDREFQSLNDPGTCVISISNGVARVIRSDCPQKICISMGEISRGGEWIACLPHGVFVSVEGSPAENAGLDGMAW